MNTQINYLYRDASNYFKQTSNEPTELITAKDVYEGFARAGKEGWDVTIYAI